MIDYLLGNAKSAQFSTLLALLNARRFYGLRTILQNSLSWSYLTAQCENKTSLPDYRDIASACGLIMIKIYNDYQSLRHNLPCMFDVYSPCFGYSTVLAIATFDKYQRVSLVNYRGCWGPAIEILRHHFIDGISSNRVGYRLLLNPLLNKVGDSNDCKDLYEVGG